MRSFFPLIPLSIACQQPPEYLETVLPQMDLSTTNLDFGEIAWGTTLSKSFYIENQGELPMGLHSLSLSEEGFENNFSILYSPLTIECPEERTADDTEYHIEEGDTILPPGCRIAAQVTYNPLDMGDAYASISVESFIEPKEFGEETISSSRFYRDPSNFKQTLLLHGYSNQGIGNVVVTPRVLDFGHNWSGEIVTQQIMINNVGDGDLLIENPTLDEGCDEAFSLDISSLDSDRIIPAGEGTIFQATFSPVDLEAATCTVFVSSNDQETDTLEISLKGNVGIDPTNTPPVVNIVSPATGYRHDSIDPLLFELSLYDANQPADSLVCKVKSMGQLSGVYDCSPEDESGFVQLEIPIDNLPRGIDTFLVTVTDQSEQQAFASTTVLVASENPASDLDMDGFGSSVDSEFEDCDEEDPTVYPFAAEIADGKDNDCDGAIDEKTHIYDDDGDSVSEAEGDCNDADVTTYPGAPELPDQRDNDCDGSIDETTSLFDDDGDGFSEVDNDCNDSDPTINPAAIEYCDNIDNNCNSLRDEQEGCVSLDTQPFIIGGIQMSERAISVGETTTMTIFVYEADNSELAFQWEEDSKMNLLGHTAISSPTAQTITWTAPDSLSTSGDGEIFSVYVIVTDSNGNQDWVFDEISVYSDPVEQTITELVVNNSGCGSSGAATALVLLPLAGFYRRRRQR
ncbi:MAG: MopE-related protein [Myxococcota bacterium]|nr:MopE-related protein [Myxococcota bacterium]